MWRRSDRMGGGDLSGTAGGRRAGASRLMRFGVVGVATFMIFYGTVFALVELAALDALVATAIAYVVAVCINYGLHHAFTFDRATTHRRSVPRYLGVICVGFTMNQAIMYLGINALGIHYLVVQLVSLCAVVTVNFLAFSLWAFAGPRG